MPLSPLVFLCCSVHRDLDHSRICLAFPIVFCFDYVLYALSYMLGHVTSSANGQPNTIKINKDFLMILLKCGDTLH